jgi:D-3-phosphoglycerate dehydrogenase
LRPSGGKTRILITDGLAKEGIDLLKTHPDFELEIRSSTSSAELLRLAPEFDALLVRTLTPVGAEVFEKAPRTRLVVTASAGFDHIDVDAARGKGVAVLNCPTANSLSAAEQTLGLMFALARNIPRSDRGIRDGKWERGPSILGTELHGKILGIIGLGNVGKITAEKAMALGMQVIAFDTAISSVSALPPKFKYLESRFTLARSQGEVLAESDWVVIHVPKEPRNVGLFGKTTIESMKKGSFLINTSRGGIVDEKSLLSALESGRLRGAAADVFEREPPDLSDPTTRGLLAHPRFVATAHLGGATAEAKERIAAQAAGQVLAFFNQGGTMGVLNG